MKRILFVDDEQNVLDGLRRMLYTLRFKWQMEFVTSGRAALKRLAEQEFDVLVTDIRMPEMSGFELLKEVVVRHPQVIRFILSGTAEREMTLQSINVAHQYLAKPCDAANIRAAMEQAFHFQLPLENPALRKLVAHVHSLPCIPDVYWKLTRALDAYDVSAKEVAGIVSQDLSMTAKVLQLVNSAVFGAIREIVDPEQAVMHLGTETIKALTLTAGAFAPFDQRIQPHFSIDALQRHSFRVAALARRIGQSMNLSSVVLNTIYAGSLLHDLGKLVLISSSPSLYEEVLANVERDGEAAAETEARVYQATHAEVGAYLLWLWGLPDTLVEIVAYHHTPKDAPTEASAAVFSVHVADALLQKQSGRGLDTACLDGLGLTGELSTWEGIRDEMTRTA